MGAARIGRIRMKDGGAEIRVLHQETADAGGEENWRGKIVEHARMIAEDSKPDAELVGFFVLGLFSDGSHSMGLRLDDDRCPIPRTLMPAYVEDIIRRDCITGPEAEGIACAVVNRSNGY